MHKGIHTPTMQTHTKTSSMSRGKQTSMTKQNSSRRMVHTAVPGLKGGRKKGY